MERESGTASAPGSLYVDLDKPRHPFGFAAQPPHQPAPKAKSKKKRKKDKR